jgi:hypothetical protein
MLGLLLELPFLVFSVVADALLFVFNIVIYVVLLPFFILSSLFGVR